MAQRLSKKPISEGFELWDKGYTLGAMRLFIFKAETSPPFQLGPCLDAIGHLLLALEEFADANENFGYAAEKYELIQQPVLANLMKVKGVEAMEGPEPALQQLTQFLSAADPNRDKAASMDTKTKSGMGRSYAYLGELKLKIDPEKNASDAARDLELGISLGWDRVHTAYLSYGQAKMHMSDVAGALASFEQAIKMNPNYLAAYENAIQAGKQLEDKAKVLQLTTEAIAVHPRSALIRERAFALSENGSDADALRYLEEMIANPPPEETDAITVGGFSTKCTLLKAKAAILADAGQLHEALAAAEAALTSSPGDEEAQMILEDIKHSM
jgi:tetratricopeptide (TPR) repeat protein